MVICFLRAQPDSAAELSGNEREPFLFFATPLRRIREWQAVPAAADRKRATTVILTAGLLADDGVLHQTASRSVTPPKACAR